jgi:hypothetical protein
MNQDMLDARQLPSISGKLAFESCITLFDCLMWKSSSPNPESNCALFVESRCEEIGETHTEVPQAMVFTTLGNLRNSFLAATKNFPR